MCERCVGSRPVCARILHEEKRESGRVNVPPSLFQGLYARVKQSHKFFVLGSQVAMTRPMFGFHKAFRYAVSA